MPTTEYMKNMTVVDNATFGIKMSVGLTLRPDKDIWYFTWIEVVTHYAYLESGSKLKKENKRCTKIQNIWE